MKLLIEPSNKNNLYETTIDGLILSLKDYAVQSPIYYTLEEIIKIRNSNQNIDIFININKNLLNSDIEPLKVILRWIKSSRNIFLWLSHFKIKKGFKLKNWLSLEANPYGKQLQNM